MTTAKGRIILSSLSNCKSINADEYWLITRGGRDIASFKRVFELAPLPALFHTYLTQWKGQPGEVWWPRYRERFNAQLATAQAQKCLHDLDILTNNGYSVVLACYCRNERFCHRRLVGDYLAGRGVEVVSFNGMDPVREKEASSSHDFEQLSLFSEEWEKAAE